MGSKSRLALLLLVAGFCALALMQQGPALAGPNSAPAVVRHRETGAALAAAAARATATRTATATNTATHTPTRTATLTSRPTATRTAAAPRIASATPARTATTTATPAATRTATPCGAIAVTPTATPTATGQPRYATPTATPCVTPTPTPDLGTPPSGGHGSETATPTRTPPVVSTPTVTLTGTIVPAATPTITGTTVLTGTPLPPVTGTPMALPTITATQVPFDTVTPSATGTVTATVVLTGTTTPYPRATVAVTGTLTPTPTRTLTVTPTRTASPTTPARALVQAALPTVPVPAPGPTITPGSNDPHVTYNAMTDRCAACHRAHTAGGRVIRMGWPEETLCFDCHASGGPGTNVQAAFTTYANTSTGFYKHDVAATNGVHLGGENSGGSYGGASRHVECEDCHNGHKATRGASGAPGIQSVMKGATGVDPTYTSAGLLSGFTWQAEASREYQVCFKCHTSFTALPTYLPDGWNSTGVKPDGLQKLTSANTKQAKDTRDLAAAFAPGNGSFHPLLAQGRNQSIPAASFVPGWSQTSMVYCSDCHTDPNSATQGVGPHGSPNLHILAGTTNYKTVEGGNAPAGTEVCFKCHDYNTYAGSGPSTNTNFRRGTRNLHTFHRGEGAFCYMCHDTHGSGQEHLINFLAGTQLSPNGTYNTQTAWRVNGAGHTCDITCHGENHSSIVYP